MSLSSSSSSSSSSFSSLSAEISAVEEKIRKIEDAIENAQSKIDFQNLRSDLSIYWREEEKQLREKEIQLREEEKQLRDEKLLLMRGNFFSFSISKNAYLFFFCFSLDSASRQNAEPSCGQSGRQTSEWCPYNILFNFLHFNLVSLLRSCRSWKPDFR